MFSQVGKEVEEKQKKVRLPKRGKNVSGTKSIAVIMLQCLP